MHSYLQFCQECDRLTKYPERCYRFLVEGFEGPFGHIIESTVHRLAWNENFAVDHGQKTVKILGNSADVRSSRLESFLLTAKEKGAFTILKRWNNDPFPIYGPGRQLALSVDRCAIPLLGVPTYASHLIVYCEDDAGISIWAARRASWKSLYPNKLSVTVAGGIPTGESPFECVVREAHEEAGLPEELVRRCVRSTGVITYVTMTDSVSTSGGEEGLIRAEVQYQYEMKVGPEVRPRPNDMEASDISLFTVEEIKQAMLQRDFTPGNACFMLDFFIRHGLVTHENEPNYTEIVQRLHRPIGVHTA